MTAWSDDFTITQVSYAEVVTPSLSWGGDIQSLWWDGPVDAVYMGATLVYQWVPPVLPVESISVGSSSRAARNAIRQLCTAYGTTYQNVEYLPFDLDLTGTTNASDLFYGFSNLKRLPNIFGLEGVTNADNFFRDCKELDQVSISLPSATTGVRFAMGSGIRYIEMSAPNMTDGRYLFEGSSRLEGGSFDLPSLTNAQWAFRGCTGLVTAPELDWPSLTNGGDLFRGCSSLTSVPATSFPAASSMSHAFRDCPNLETVGSLSFGTSSVNLSYLFYGDANLSSVGDIIVTSTSSCNYMFQDCAALTDGNVRIIIGAVPSGGRTAMIRNSGLTREPFYNAAGNPI